MGSRALRGPAECQTGEQGRVRRRRRGGATMQGSWCLPGGAAAVAEEEAAEGIEGGEAGGGLETVADKRRCGARACERESETFMRAFIDRGPVCATSFALAHEGRDGCRTHYTKFGWWRAIGRGVRHQGVQKSNKEQAGRKGAGRGGGGQLACSDTTCPSPPTGRTQIPIQTIESAEHGASEAPW